MNCVPEVEEGGGGVALGRDGQLGQHPLPRLVTPTSRYRKKSQDFFRIRAQIIVADPDPENFHQIRIRIRILSIL